jgi:mono/diheme cytochrome c family protein
MSRSVMRTTSMAVAMMGLVLLVATCGAAPEPAAEPTQPPPEATQAPAQVEPTQMPAQDEPTAPPEEQKLFPPQMPSAARGRSTFAANCASCHGTEGDGSGLAGAADFTDLAFMRGEKPAEFFEAIRDGVEGTAMPAWGGTLSEMDIWDVLYYEWSFATSPEEVALGTELFSASCVACHGEEGDGSALEGAADFTDQEFMANEDPAEFFEKITEGVEGTAMPAWGGQFSEDEIWALVNTVWTFAYEYGDEPAGEPTSAPSEATAPTEEGKLFPSGMPSTVRGEAIFAASCAACHGEAGDGSGLEGAADFTDVEFMRGEKPAEFFEAIREGVAGTAMAAWGDRLSELDIWDVLYYEWTFATSPEEIAEGEELYSANCTGCHGEAGDGSGLAGAADFTDQEFMANEDPEEFFESITKGVGGTAMPAWDDAFTADQIWSLVNYVWSFAYEHEGVAQAPTEEPPPAVTLPTEPDPGVGQQVWAQKPCAGCHGEQAQGGIGPKLAGTALEADEVLLQVRVGAAPMPAFSAEEVSDLEVEHIYAWLWSLAPPTPTPPPAPAALPPSGHLMAFWEHVNRVKVHSDFAKDASPDIGALHGRVSQARDEANGALREADLAIGDIPDSKVQATINRVKGFVNQILGHADAALATNDLNAARAEAAHMVEISRLDAWPLASQAVKQAGFTGTVRVRVKDPSGRPIQGALVTALTAPNPSAGITDGNGRVTIPDLAAVRVMQVKAYDDGLVYHEVHVTVPVGGRADAEITLPGPSVAGQAPVVSNASISPSSGSGSAQVTFRMTGTDPQGHANIAEDQVFALNPDLGKAYVLRSAGGDDWQSTVTLPNLAPGTHTWYFFIVDHQCNTSSIVPLTYTVQ